MDDEHPPFPPAMWKRLLELARTTGDHVNVNFRYWQSPSGHPQYVYVDAPGHPQIYGQHIKGDRIRWCSKSVTPAEAEELGRLLVGDQAPTWSALVALANQPKTSSSQRASGGFNRGGLRGPQYSRKGTSFVEITGRQQPYTAADTAALDPYGMAHPLPEPTKLLIDHREPAAIADALRLVPNLEVEITTLELGDYLVPERFIIERKTTNDFQQSIVEDAKRLFTQTQAIAELGIPALVLVEGGTCAMRSMELNAIYGTLSFISLIQGIPVLETLDQHSSVYMIVKTIRHACYGLGYDLGLRSGAAKKAAKQADPLAAAAFVLEGIAGVSAARARALLTHFGSVQAVAGATIADLCKVDGIGKTTATAIHQTLSAPPVTR